jgi:hypothetical protein
MAQNIDSIISILNQAESVISDHIKREDFKSASKQIHALTVIGKFVGIPHVAIVIADLRLKSDYDSIISSFPISEIANIRAQVIAQDEAQKQTPEQDTSIPPELESMLAEYRENQAEKEAHLKEYSSTHEHIERAVKAMELRRRRETIFANRQRIAEEQGLTPPDDPRDLLVKVVDPRHKSYASYSKNERQNLNQFLAGYLEAGYDPKQIDQISDRILNLSLVGAVDLSDPKSLALATETARYDLGLDSHLTPAFEAVKERQQEIAQNTDQIHSLELEISHLSSSNNPNKEADIQYLLSKISALDKQVTDITGRSVANPALEQIVTLQAQKALSVIEDKINNPDLESNLKDTQTKHAHIQDKLVEKGATGMQLPVSDPLQIRISDPDIGQLTLSQAIRADLPADQATLAINGQVYGHELASILASSELRNEFSPEIIRLYSQGLTSDLWDKVIASASTNPNSYLGKLYQQNPKLFGQIRRQLTHLSNTHLTSLRNALSDKIRDKAKSILGEIYAGGSFRTKSGKTISGKEIIDKYADELAKSQQKAKDWLKQAHLKSKEGRKLRRELERIRRSTLAQEIQKKQGVIGQITQTTYNRLYKKSLALAKDGVKRAKKAGKYLGYALDPIGSVKRHLAEKVGAKVFGRIISKFGSDRLKELLLKEGFKNTLKIMAQESAKKLAIMAAKQAGLQAAKISAMAAADSFIAALAAALGVSTFGLSLIVGAILIVGGAVVDFTVGALNKIKTKLAKELYGEDVKPRELLALVGGVIVGSKLLKSGFNFVRTMPSRFALASLMAVGSAAGIIVISAIAVYFFYVTSLVMAPLISTLVNLESQSHESGPLSCANMPWPFDGTYSITQGPRQTTNKCTHKGSLSESADFGMSTGTPIKSMSEGKVLFAGLDPSSAGGAKSGYGYYADITAKTDDGKEFMIRYAHFSTLTVRTGDTVRVGQVIGLSGNTGYSTGSHLHLEYRGMEYNLCPAGGHQIVDNCCSSSTCNQP